MVSELAQRAASANNDQDIKGKLSQCPYASRVLDLVKERGLTLQYGGPGWTVTLYCDPSWKIESTTLRGLLEAMTGSAEVTGG